MKIVIYCMNCFASCPNTVIFLVHFIQVLQQSWLRASIKPIEISTECCWGVSVYLFHCDPHYSSEWHLEIIISLNICAVNLKVLKKQLHLYKGTKLNRTAICIKWCSCLEVCCELLSTKFNTALPVQHDLHCCLLLSSPPVDNCF
jgi:hypothetical protein